MKLPDGYTPGVGVVKATGFGGLGERLLSKFGWIAGKGLGKDEQGMAEAIEIQKKEDTGGVGAGPGRNWDSWWEDAYAEAATRVRATACGDEPSSSSSSDDSSDDEDDGGLRGRVRSVNRDGTVASGSVDELKLLARLSKGAGRVAAGRFGGRDAKMERIRRHEAEEAARMRQKLGLDSGDSGVTGADGGSKKKRKKGSEGSEGSEGREGSEG